jgi:hypothetical protein
MLRGIEVIFYDRLFDLGYAPFLKHKILMHTLGNRVPPRRAARAKLARPNT